MNQELAEGLKKMDKELKKEGLTRREAIKLLGAGAGATALLAVGGNKLSTLPAVASNKRAKILIIGGGLAGMSTAARLSSQLKNAEITVVEPNKKSVSYQPGNTFIGAGVYDKQDVMYKTRDFIPEGVNMIFDKAVEFDPEANSVVLQDGTSLTYDYLVVAAGLTFDFARIKGLEELGDMNTLDDGCGIKKFFGNSGVSTIYNTDVAELTWENMQDVITKAANGKKIEAVFTHPNTAIKCGGAPKKIMYLMHDRLIETGESVRNNVNMTFYPNGGKLFGVPEYEKAIEQHFKERNFTSKFKHNLTGVNLQKKIAIFDHHWTEKGEYDPDLEEYDIVTKNEKVEVPFDFLHIAPPAKAPDLIGKSPLGSGNGWIPVNKETLQHVKYDNVFSLGDIAAIPLGKTGGSIRKQYKVLCDNLVALIEGKEMTAKYDGYTVCPIITGIGSVMLAEFDWSMKPKPSFPLDPTQERYIWWVLKAHILKPMTQHGMLAGLV